MGSIFSLCFYKAIEPQKPPAQNPSPGKVNANTLFVKMSSRKLDKSQWKVEGHRRSPRLMDFTGASITSNSATAATKNICKQKMKRLLGNDQGPASRTRARKKRNLRPVQQVAAKKPSSQSNQGRVGTNYGDHRMNGDQPSNESSLWLPEKRILELILDTLQRKDTYEIFAEPVDPNEVEDYYEIIEKPMDFGTMRAKLHEGMYQNLQQFEHDAFLITENAMHFNSSGTIYFRQGRAIHELTKKVFHVLRTYPENFELEFSETRTRSGRRAQGEAGRSASSSYPKAESSKAMPCSLNGLSNIRSGRVKTGCSGALDARECRVLSETQRGRRPISSEEDPRHTYRPWTSFLNENESIRLAESSNLKQLEHVNQQDIGYKESLMLFVKDLGPAAQMVARKKLLGWSQLQKSQQVPTSTLSNVFTSPPSQSFQDNPHGHQRNADHDKEEKRVLLCDEMASSSDRNKSHSTLGGKFHSNRRSEVQLDSDSSKAHGGDSSCSNFRLKNTGNDSTVPQTLNQWKLANQAQYLEPTSDYSQSNLLDPRLKSMGFACFSQTKNALNTLHLRGDYYQPKAETSQVSKDSKPDQAKPVAHQFTFDLPYLRSQLGKINSRAEDRLLQRGSGAAELTIFPESKSYQKTSTCTRHVDMTKNQLPYGDYQNQSSVDTTKYTDLALQL